MKYIIFITLLSAAVLANSCTKKPEAGFTTDKYQYVTGETMVFTNTSTDGSSFEWTGTGISGVVTTKDLQMVAGNGGTYSINLKAYSKNKKKSSTKRQDIVVRIPVIFYAASLSNGDIDVWVDGVYLGRITQAYSTAPDCGAQGCLTISLEEGEHTVQSSVNGMTIASIRKITPQACFKIKLN